MNFLAVKWLWALLLVPAGAAYLVWDQRRRRENFAGFADPAIWRAIAPELDPGARTRKGWFWLAAMACAVVALARPQWGAHEETVQVSGLDIIIALDVSNSMDVEDVVPSRLKKAKHLIRALVDRLNGDRVGVVAFAASSYVACPLTTDIGYALDAVDVLSPKSVTNQGTDIGIALETSARAMDRGAEESANKSSPTASRAVILISDGEDHLQQAADGVKMLKNIGARLYVFGIGTQKGGPVPVRDELGQLHGYKRERGGEAVVSSFRPDALTRLAQEGGGKYWNVTPNETEIEELLQDLGALSRGEFMERRVVTYEERFYFPLGLAVLLFFIELSLAARRLGRKAAGSVAVLMLVLMGLVAGPRAEAAFGQVPLETFLSNEEGIRQFDAGKLDEAKKAFGEAQARNPELPELLYNQGSVQLKEGDVEGAIKSFDGAARAANDAGKHKLSGRAWFNLGSALAQKGDVGTAVQAYVNSIDSAQSAKDVALEDDARKNLELLIRDQKKQQQQKQEQKKDEQKKDEQQKDQQKKEDQKPDNKKDQPQQFADNSQNQRKQDFRSLKLSKEDADRVMAELSNRERELQAKLKKQRGQASSTQKDW